MSFVRVYRRFDEAQDRNNPVQPRARFTGVVVMTTGVITSEEDAAVSASEDSSQAGAGERITDAEHAVMEVLWERPRQTAAEVCEDVCAQRGWSLATVKTLLSRLVQKGAAAAEPDGRRFLYSPLIAREDYVGGESRRLVDRLFGGSAASLVAHLAETEALTADDLAEIEALLKELKS